MPVSFELTLLERQTDRVVVTISLCPGGEAVELDGVAVEILSPRRERISPRLLLPVSGTLVGPLVTQAELRAFGPIPACSVISGTAWSGEDQVECACPADDHIGLEAHVRGSNPPVVRSDAVLLDLLPEERQALATCLPWLLARVEAAEEPLPTQVEGTLAGEASPSELFEPDLSCIREEMDGVCKDLGLDEECSEWLKELMAD